MVSFDSLVHKDGVGIEVVLGGARACFVGLAQDDDGLGFARSSLLQVCRDESRASDEVDLLKDVDLGPNECVSVKVLVSQAVVAQDYDWPDLA